MEKDGLPTSIVYCSKRDSNGVLWIGHEKGLSRYDGNEWMHFGIENGLEPAVLGINFYGGTVWCGTETGLFRMTEKSENKKPKFVRVKGYKFLGPVSNLVVWNNRLWVGSKIAFFSKYSSKDLFVSMIYKENGKFNIKNMGLNESKNGHTSAIIAALDTTLWISTGNIYKINKNNPDKIENADIFEIPRRTRRVFSIYRSFANSYGFFAASDEGLYKFDFKLKNCRKLLSGTTVAVEQVGSNLWVSQPGIGIIILTKTGNKILDTIGIENGLANSNLNGDLFVDFDGSVWIPSYSGLTHILSTSLKYYFQGHTIKAINEFRNEVYVGFENKIYSFKRKKIVYNYRTPSNTYHLLGDIKPHNNKLWVSTGSGLYSLNNKNILELEIQSTQSIPFHFPLRKFRFIDKRYMFLSTARGFAIVPLNQHERNQIHTYLTGNDNIRFNKRGIKVLTFANDKIYVWIGTTQGLFLFNKRTFSVEKAKLTGCDISNLKIKDIKILKRKKYLATSKGIKIINGNTVTDYLPNAISFCVNDLLFYGKFLFAGTENGLFIIKDNKIIKKLTGGNVLPHVYVNKIFLDSKRNLWIGTNSGIVTISLSEIINEPKIQSLYITKIVRNKKVIFQHILPSRINYPECIELERYRDKIKIYLTSKYIESHCDVKYELTIKNDDNKYTLLNSKPYFVLDELKSGLSYIYIRIVFASGKKSNPLILKIDSPPPLYLTWQFLLIEALIIILLGLVVSYIHTRTIRKRNVILQKEIDKQTKQLRETNVKLEEKIKEATELLRVRAVFINFFAHDISNAIANVRRTVELLHKGLTLDTKINTFTLEYYLNMSIERMIKIIKKVLMVGRIESKNIKTKYQLIDIVGLVKEEIDKNKNYFHEKNLNVELQTSNDTIIIHSDIQIFKEIFENILNNAAKYTPHNGNISVKCKRYHTYTEIIVTDTGPGFPEDEFNLLYKPFMRLSTEPTGGESSIGLGLWIVKSLLDLIRGEIIIQNYDKGANVSVKIPNSQSDSIE